MNLLGGGIAGSGSSDGESKPLPDVRDVPPLIAPVAAALTSPVDITSVTRRARRIQGDVYFNLR